jgi:serine/threonine protein kinase
LTIHKEIEVIHLPERYQPTGEVASGGFSGITYCTDIHLQRPVAVKFLKDPEEIKRLMDELSALMLMRSKHVVQVYDIIYDSGSPIGIVEEYITGDDLFQSDKAQSSLDDYLKTIWQLAAGIADIHAAAIIHRDIKPNNMKLDDEGVLKIFDFGLARDVGPEAATKGFKGTLYFAAPELFSADHVEFTTAIDVYAFGATACYLTDKSLPEQLGKTPPEPVLSDVFTNKPIGIPPEIDSLLLSCLHHNPEHRPDMVSVRDTIARYLLKDKHQAVVVYNNTPSSLSRTKRNVRLKWGIIGEIEIEYDGLRFIIKSADGEVFINNKHVVVGDEIPGSCVVALGAPERKAQRRYVTFDVSHPEVVL